MPVGPSIEHHAEQWAARLDRVIDGRPGVRAEASGTITSVFQPIVDLPRRTIVGFEALSRFSNDDGIRRGPDEWFAAANALGLTAELDHAALSSALLERSRLPRNCFLTINVDPESLLDRAVMSLLFSQGSLDGLVIEITEHRPWNWDDLSPAVDRLRSAGAMFAVDDAGAGYSGLQQILQLRPSILKLDRSLVEGVDHDEAKRALIEMLGIFANRIDAWILAEGVETLGEARALDELEVPLVQGYFLSRPAPPWASLDPDALSTLGARRPSAAETLHHLVAPETPIADSALLAERWLDRDRSWVAVVDDDHRPLGLLDAEGAATGVLTAALSANLNTSPSELAQRVATSTTAFSGAPVIVTDNAGRYVGLISMKRLIGALTATAR